MAAVTTADQIKVEDLSKALILSDVKKTPFSSRMRKGEKLKDVIYSWSASPEDPRREGGIPENEDVGEFEGDNAQKLYNRSQRFWRTPRVTVEAQKLSGGAENSVITTQKYAGQVTKKIRAQKKDIEKNLLSDQDSQEDKGIPGEGNGRKFKGIGRVINDGIVLSFTDTQTAVPAGWRTPSAQIYTGAMTDFTEDTLRAMLQSRFDLNGDSSELTLYCGSALKSYFDQTLGWYKPNKDGYTVLARTTAASGRKYAIGAVDIIETPFGDVELVLCSFIGAADGKPTSAVDTKRGYLVDDSQLFMRPLMYCDKTDLPYQGGGMSGLIDSIMGWEYGNPQQDLAIRAT